MKHYLTLSLLSILLIISACQKDADSSDDIDKRLESALQKAADGKGIAFFRLPSSSDYSNIPQDPKNQITNEKVVLGQQLYHETGLAINPKLPEGKFTYSCASCHHSRAGFQAGRRQGISEGGNGFGLAGEGRNPNPNYLIDSLDVQPLRTPTVLNSAYQINMLWNGQFGATGLNVGTEDKWTAGTPIATNELGYEGVEIQAIAGLKVHRMGIDKDFCKTTTYEGLFQKAFPNATEDELLTTENAGLAIAAYERTVLANNSPFQEWLSGSREAMFKEEKQGALLFFGKANCNACHTGPALNVMDFYAIGMADLEGFGIYGSTPSDGAHKGRGGFTGDQSDDFKFKVPQLYNLKDSPFMGHGGTFSSVREVIEYKNKAIADKSSIPEGQLATEFIPLNLTDEEITQLTSFIENGLYDPTLSRYDPNKLPSGNCFPNNDTQSKIDLGCN